MLGKLAKNRVAILAHLAHGGIVVQLKKSIATWKFRKDNSQVLNLRVEKIQEERSF